MKRLKGPDDDRRRQRSYNRIWDAEIGGFPTVEVNDLENMALATLQFSGLLIRCIGFPGGAFRLGGQVLLQIMGVRLPNQDMLMGND
jgi:hypothetical protein